MEINRIIQQISPYQKKAFPISLQSSCLRLYSTCSSLSVAIRHATDVVDSRKKGLLKIKKTMALPQPRIKTCTVKSPSKTNLFTP